MKEYQNLIGNCGSDYRYRSYDLQCYRYGRRRNLNRFD